MLSAGYFDNLGIKNYLIEIGGEVRAKGTKAGALWRIGIDKPEDNNMSPGADSSGYYKNYQIKHLPHQEITENFILKME